MREYVVNRPDEAAMHRILAQAGPEGVLLRLAWQAGLSREEISALTWAQVSFSDDRLELPDRQVPLVPALREALWPLWEARREPTGRVVLSTRSGTPLAPESISRLARQALDREGQTAVRLMDLRHDWIIRQLCDGKDWAAVSRISGVEISTLQARFARFLPEGRPVRLEAVPAVDEFKLWRVLQSERSTPAGLALWLTWQLGLQAQEIVSLTWDQVDLRREVLCLPDREVPLTNAVRRILEEARRKAGDDPHVLLTERSRKPMDLPRLSRMTRSALIRGGMEHVLLRDLRKDEAWEDETARILELAAQKGLLARGDVMELLDLSKTAAHARLARLMEERKLVRVGGKYYLPGTVVPPEEQQAAILAYLERSGFAYRQDITALLGVQPKQCSALLRRLVREGRLVQSGQKYFLPQPEARKAE